MRFLKKLSSYFVKNSNDCLICSFRPLYYLGIGFTYLAIAECPHSKPVLHARFRKSRFVFIWTLALDLILALNIFLGVMEIIWAETLDTEQVLAVAKAVNTISYQLSLLYNNKRYLDSCNYLLKLLESRKVYGIKSILTRERTRNSQIMSIGLTITAVVYLSNYCRQMAPPRFEWRRVIYFVASLNVQLNYINMTTLIFVHLHVYYISLLVCYQTLQETLNHLPNSSALVTVEEKLKFAREFYIRVCLNYRKHLMGPGNTLYFAEQLIFAIFLFVATYGYVRSCLHSGAPIKTEVVGDVIGTAITTVVLNMAAHVITLSSQDLLSFLHKYPINSLSALEAAQVEMLIATLTLEKPELRAANIFTIGSNLLASIAGNVVTYVLVALQFNASFFN